MFDSKESLECHKDKDHGEEETIKDTSFVFSELMMDEILQCMNWVLKVKTKTLQGKPSDQYMVFSTQASFTWTFTSSI